MGCEEERNQYLNGYRGSYWKLPLAYYQNYTVIRIFILADDATIQVQFIEGKAG